MRRPHFDSAAAKRPAWRSRAPWLGLIVLAILLGGGAAWFLRGPQPAAQPTVAATSVAPPEAVSTQTVAAPQPTAAQTASAPQQALLPQPAIPPQQPTAPTIIEARLADIDGLRHPEQGRAMNRLAALIEKSGMPHDRVLSAAEMAAAVPNPDTYYLAHDYAATSLARFFSLAEAETQPLNQQERDLLALLMGARVIERAAAGGYAATKPEMAVITLVQADSPGVPTSEVVDASLRDTMLHHEVSHGEFFTNPAYRAHCERFWRERLSESERALFRSFLAGNGYDPADETLMINEMQAYLMHTPDPRAFSAKLLHVTPAQLADLRKRFMNPQPPTPLLGGKAPANG